MKISEHEILGTKPGSIAREMGIEPGDLLIAINGQAIADIIDYIEWTSQENLDVIIRKPNDEEWSLIIDKNPEDDLGILFVNPLMDCEKQCRNKCVFCFVDQLPNGMRDTLYEKDDDWRLSFLMGNYITLTNLSPGDLNKIIDRRISPLYVSIHTTNPKLRQKMLRNKNAARLLDILEEFSKARIEIHCQIVLCPGINDGNELERTIKDLWRLRSIVKSVSVVPVGLTRHRSQLEKIRSFDMELSKQLIDQLEKWQKQFKREEGTSFIFAADEFYVLAGYPFPPYEFYEDFYQIENGVGLVAKLQKEFNEALNNLPRKEYEAKKVSIVTGLSAYPIINELACQIHKFTGIRVYVYPICNNFFGTQITVSGLVTGQDIIAQLKGKDLGERLLIPFVMLRKGEDVFLDNITINELEKELRVPVRSIPVDGVALIEAVIG